VLYPIQQIALYVLDDHGDRKAELHLLSVNAYVPSFANYYSIHLGFEMGDAYWLASCLAGCDRENLYCVVVAANLDLLYGWIFAMESERIDSLEFSAFDYHPISESRRAAVFFFECSEESHQFLSSYGVYCKAGLEKH